MVDCISTAGGGVLNAASDTCEDDGSSCWAVSLWASGAAICCSEATAAGVGTKNLAPDSGLTDGAAGLLYDVAAPEAFAPPPPPPLLKVSTYLDLTPILPRAENWFWVGGIGGIPERGSKGLEFLASTNPLAA